ncbi:MAG: LysR family transcriptional regulator [Dyella sp.]|nr:LysR family transcriptional regulator [Dyella sp.]MBV8270661.1 LysR family transcriptional regulator [Cupriavidus sp.]
MELQRVDLNLLKIFECVYRHRSLTETAHEINLSQPAVSHALSRLRNTLGDKLFVKTSTGLEPTSRSDELAGPIKAALLMLEEALLSGSEFHPLMCKRTFRLILSDVGELIFVPRLLRHMQLHAPLSTVDVIPASRTESASMLREREADFAIGPQPKLGSSMKQRKLFDDDWVAMRRKPLHQHAGLAASPLTLDAYVSALHVAVDPRGTEFDHVDVALNKLQIFRKIALRLPHFFSLPSVIRETDLLATVPRSIAISLGDTESFDIAELPFEVEPHDVRIYWHPRQDADPAMRWFRDEFVSQFGPR